MMQACPVCQGLGIAIAEDERSVRAINDDDFEHQEFFVDCPLCEGSGMKSDKD